MGRGGISGNGERRRGEGEEGRDARSRGELGRRGKMGRGKTRRREERSVSWRKEGGGGKITGGEVCVGSATCAINCIEQMIFANYQSCRNQNVQNRRYVTMLPNIHHPIHRKFE